jgi:hypothetical protein
LGTAQGRRLVLRVPGQGVEALLEQGRVVLALGGRWRLAVRLEPARVGSRELPTLQREERVSVGVASVS